MPFSRLQITVAIFLSQLVLSGPIVAQQGTAPQASLRRLQPSESRSTSAVVIQDSPLLHTTQLLPLDADGRLVGAGHPTKQIDQLLDNLEILLLHCGASTDRFVKLNVYVRDSSVREAFNAKLNERMTKAAQPATAFVATELPRGAWVGLDAVVSARNGSPKVVRAHVTQLAGNPRMAHAAWLPQGDVVYVSGQAEQAESLADATQDTLAGLRRTLEHLGLAPSDVVQVKCFMKPMAESGVVRNEVLKFFGEQVVPPLALVEWVSSLPIEIELVAHAPSVASKESVTYATPPWMTGSPVYSRVARIHGNSRIYVSGLTAAAQGDGGQQVRDIFSSLAATLKLAGSDLRHLAKATYYVSDDDASRQLNQLRPSYYDPQRPPAASKAMVQEIGVAHRSITLDMIAAPAGD